MRDNKGRFCSTHGACHKGKPSLTYYVWAGLKQRCNNPRNHAFNSYGGRGITVCKEWESSFSEFLNDMGEKPEGLSLERLNNDKGYYKQNCIWTDRIAQANNRRTNKFIKYDGELYTVTNLSRFIGINVSTLRKRIEMGWSIEKCANENVDKSKSTKKKVPKEIGEFLC